MSKHMKYEKWQRQTALFLGSQTISLFGSSLVQYAIFWYLTLETQSGVIMTLSTIFGFLPTFFISPFAGVWADRYNRKRLIVLSDGITAISTLVLVLLFLAGQRSIWILLATSAIRAVGAGIQMPAVGAILPQIVPEKELTRINGLNGSIQAVVMLVSPMISGALYQFAPMEGIFLIDIVTAALAIAILVFLLKVPTHEKASQEQVSNYLQDMKLGFRYIQNHAFIKRLFLYFSLAFFMAAPVSFLSPLQVARSFGEDVWRLTAIEIAFSIGMIGGGLWIASWGGFKNRIHSIAAAIAVMGLSTFGMGVIPDFWIYLFLMGLVGLFIPLLNAPSMTLLQEKVEEDFLGRVFGVQSMVASSMMPLGMLVFGPLADRMAIEILMAVSGVFLMVVAFFAIRDRVLLEAGKPEDSDKQG
ncbi:DHA3 family macrolide efflux protein-like MFS transporter [Trichococcus patagoniensis]|uniref:DHA3 family macrolide efflux protein-like MFS transporter n=1 Tax=Trichococcus patagoniensis TaxID=382641 RepID=A0A2T5IJU0_9LACT|nr:MFS transporter [Trichococcus patagoniensis]PTQ84093.1 DHA3 family macrolide efflux protein-like MFS transporter [Trichococcus patagoniensis]